MERIAKKILKHLGNEHTKVERKQGFMGNYYSPHIDTIYIAENYENTKVPVGAEKINKKAAELIVACHECFHSVQSKILHLLNTIFANISMILSIICIFISLFETSLIWLKTLTTVTLVVSIAVRWILEIGAINGSIEIAKQVVDKKIIDDVSDEDMQESIKYINKNKLNALILMILDKIVFLLLVWLIK